MTTTNRPTVPSHEVRRVLADGDDADPGALRKALLMLLTETGLRASTICGLDYDDLRYNEGAPYLAITHRPSTDSPLKGGESEERYIWLSSETARTLEQHQKCRPNDATDQHGREPLIAFSSGRPTRNQIHLYVQTAFLVSSSLTYNPTPHTIRRSYIEHEQDSRIPSPFVALRCGLTGAVQSPADNHRQKLEQMEVRREVFETEHERRSPYGR